MTEQQEKFAIEYAASGNATQAALKAGYSKSTAESQCSRLLGIVEVQEKIEELKSQQSQELRERMAREASTAFSVLQEIMNNADARDADRIKCAVDLLDRAGYVAEKKVAIRANEDKSLERLRQDMVYDDIRTCNGADTE